MKESAALISALLLSALFVGCSEPLTTREKGAAIGTFSGAGLGAIIGSATGTPVQELASERRSGLLAAR